MKWGEPEFSEVLLGGYLALQTLLWGGMAASVGRWQKQFALPSAPALPLPRLSICIPARDEAHQIVACVQAALSSQVDDLEVIVVDDHSTDGTGTLVQNIQDSRLRLLKGAPLPAGWAGKNWACSQAAAESTGTLLLFIDADVCLSPQAAPQAMRVLIGQQLSLLSLFGTWKLESFWERVAIPVIGWFVRGSVDLAAVNTPGRKEAFANGQFILVNRENYSQMGGHGAIRATVLDDVRLAQAFKQRALPIGLYHAPDAFQVRLYRNLSEILSGYTKNFYEGMNRNPQLAMGALLFLFIGAGLPYLLLGLAVLMPNMLLVGLDTQFIWQIWILTVCLLPILFRYRLERADGRSGLYAWTHPLGNLILGIVLLRSLMVVQTAWKGRVFFDGKAG